MFILKRAGLMTLFILLFGSIGFSADANGEYFPSDSWQSSSPEAQGIDGKMLDKMLEFVEKNKSEIHACLVLRHGYLVKEAYFHPFNKNEKQHLFSCTKSFTSSLIGIALKQGVIRSLDQKVLDFFPEFTNVNDERKKDITIRHLLTMTSGLENDNYLMWGLSQRSNWVKFILDDCPMITNPGTAFGYSSLNSHLLSAILQKATGMQTSLYAEQYLFKPLGITNYFWQTDPEGVSIGGWGLALEPSDMAKLGYLYLNKGKWNNEQVVPADYIRDVTAVHVLIPQDLVLTEVEMKEIIWAGYGYQYWVAAFGGFSAVGFAGQYIFSIPDLDMVVVFISGLNPFHVGDLNHTVKIPFQLIKSFILPAASSQDLTAETNGGKTTDLLDRIENPKPKARPLPGFARSISGKMIRMASNPLKLDSLKFHFNKENECVMDQAWGEGKVKSKIVIGLDGLYRRNVNGVDCRGYYPEMPIPEVVEFARGKWNHNQFTIEFLDPVARAVLTEWIFTFNGSRISINAKSNYDYWSQEMEGSY